MELVHKITLQGTLSLMKVGEQVFVPDAMYKETSTRVSCSKVGKRTGKRFSVAVAEKGCTITRLS